MPSQKKVVITGATGLIGKRLTQELKQKGYEVVILSRSPEKAKKIVPTADRHVAWSTTELGAWKNEVDNAFGIIHLAGTPVFGKRWSESYKKDIRDSRVNGTRLLVEAMKEASSKPSVFVSGSAIGFYGFTESEKLTESAPSGSDFLAKVGVEWEAEAEKATEMGIRTAIVRTGIVLDATDGALKKMLPPFYAFVGGPILPGSQYFSWIHIEDEIGIILHALENTSVSGPINATAPEPLTMIDFCKAIGKAIGRPSWAPVPGFMLQIMLGDVSTMLSKGQRVIPQKAVSTGYQFKFPNAVEAIIDLTT